MGVNYKFYACGLSPHDKDSSFTTFINETNESGGHSFTNIYNNIYCIFYHVKHFLKFRKPYIELKTYFETLSNGS